MNTDYKKLIAPALVGVLPNLLHTLDMLKSVLPVSMVKWVQLVSGIIGVVWAFLIQPSKA